VQTNIPLILLALTATLGLVLGAQFLRGVRSHPMLISAHLLGGAAALETVVMVLRGAADGTLPVSSSHGQTPATFLACAMFIGLLIPVIAKRSRHAVTVAVALHASVACCGVVLAAAWLLHRV